MKYDRPKPIHATHSIICANCGSPAEKRSWWAKFCSAQCRTDFFNARVRRALAELDAREREEKEKSAAGGGLW